MKYRIKMVSLGGKFCVYSLAWEEEEAIKILKDVEEIHPRYLFTMIPAGGVTYSQV